jgi:RNA polymerase sigma factor for flagellar operon FliA
MPPRRRIKNTRASRDELLVEGVRMVERLTRRHARSVPQIWRDDLRSAALEALLSVVDDFDPDRGIKFSTFAKLRLEGAIVDERRRLFTGRHGPRGWGTDRRREFSYHQFDIKNERVIDLTDQVALRNHVPIDGPVLDRLDGMWATSLLRHLSDRYREIATLYFVDQLPIAEIGQRHGVTESRISQILGEIRGQLRLMLA